VRSAAPKLGRPAGAFVAAGLTTVCVVTGAGCKPHAAPGNPDNFWKPAAEQGLDDLSPAKRDDFRRLVDRSEIPSADELVASRGLFTFQDGKYRLARPPRRQISEKARIGAGHIDAAFLGHNGESLAFSNGKSLVVVRSGAKSSIPLHGERLVAADFQDDGSLLFATQGERGVLSAHTDRATVATGSIDGQTGILFACRPSPKDHTIVAIRRGATTAEAYRISRSGHIETQAVSPDVTSDCQAADMTSSALLSWTGAMDAKIDGTARLTPRALGENQLSRAADPSTGRVLYRSLTVSSGAGAGFIPMSWEVEDNGFQPRHFYAAGIGPLNGGGHIEPLGDTSYVMIAADGVLSITDGRTCLLSDEGLGLGGFYVRRGDFLAVYNPYTGIIAVVAMRACETV
jgi:hypothetical protein